MIDGQGFSWVGDVLKAFFDATLAFHDRAPLVASTGYLLICGSIPLFLLLRFALKMKSLDNESVNAKYQHSLSLAQLAVKQSEPSNLQ